MNTAIKAPALGQHPRSGHLPAEERRAVTIEAVIALAATTHPREITTAAIARHMNLTQGALFRHFPSKESLWESVMEWVAERLLARIDRAVAGVDSPLVALRTMFMSHVEFVIEHPGVPRMMFGELQRSDGTPAKQMARTVLERYSTRVHRRIEEGKAGGEISKAIDTQAAATLFVGMLQGLVMQSMLGGDISWIRKQAPGVFDIFERGLREPGAAT